MSVVAVVQARMSSTRLPGKVLLPLAGKPVLEHVVDRVSYCQTIDKVVVATSIDASDDAIKQWCDSRDVSCYRGSLHDVLDRYYHAAREYEADTIVRITADCPAIDPAVVDEVIQGYMSDKFECYGLAGEFPDGLDCTVFAFAAIERAWREAKLPSEREHVGPYIENNPQWFKTGALVKFSGLAHMRWTLDEPRDLAFLEEVFSRLHRDDAMFHTHDILALLDREPALIEINKNITRNAGYLKSLQTDKLGRNHLISESDRKNRQ
jgi:spore coat polysaccharide biosynthesis protein SpsF